MLLISLAFAACAWGFDLQTDNSYDYFLFVTEWKPTNCKYMTCPSAYIGEAFNIHGLWPERTDGSYPASCSTAPFSVSSSLEAQMNQYWESYNGNNVDFWTHEWSKHGTCVTPSESPDTYFASALNLFLTADPQKLLATHNIVPSNSGNISTAAVYSAFATEVNLACHCSNNICYLQTLTMCVDKALSFMDCPRKNSNCGSTLVLPIS